jgi:hypothetical protein
MSIEQAPSILILIGASTVTVGLLYGLQLLLEDTESQPNDQMERLRESRRLETRRYVEELKGMDAEDRPLLSPELSRIETVLRGDARINTGGNSASESLEQAFGDDPFQPEAAGDALPILIRMDMTVREEKV